jgi:hypothetical protein
MKNINFELFQADFRYSLNFFCLTSNELRIFYFFEQPKQ